MPPATFSRRSFHAATAAAAVAFVAGCTGEDEDPQTGNGEPDAVNYLTGFGAAAAHDAFAWVAKDKGFFTEAGLDVTINPGAGAQNYAPMLAGQVQFTYTDLTGLLMEIGNGTFTNTDFRALAAVHQQTLAAIVAPEDSGITSPADLEGKRVGALTGSTTETLLPAYSALADFDLSTVEIVNADPQGLFGLLAGGQVDALSTFSIQRGFIESIIEKPTVMFPFSDFLPDLLGTGLITTGAIARDNPDMALRFRDSALRGLQFTIDNPEEAVEIMAANNESINAQAAVGQIRGMTPYITAGGVTTGAIDQTRAVRCISVLQGAGLIPAGLTVDAMIDPALTLA